MITGADKEFWTNKMGIDVKNTPRRDGFFDEWYVLDDDAVSRGHIIVLNADGNVSVINAETEK